VKLDSKYAFLEESSISSINRLISLVFEAIISAKDFKDCVDL